jgi:large subunit ribosomal protein L6
MSRVGLKPIEIPGGVTVTFENHRVTAKGPKGTITRELPQHCDFEVKEKAIRVKRLGEGKTHRSMHGLTRTLLANMVVGVSKGFSKDLEIVGVGYKAELKGKVLSLHLGYSHPISFPLPSGITVEIPAPNQVKVMGIEKELVGQVAADIRSLRPPEPYKGKGVRYAGEYVQRKAGKAAIGT